MRIVCVLLIFWGACIILYSIMDYYRDLVFIRDKTSAQKIFSSKLSILSFGIMVLFLVGYLAIDIIYLFREISEESVVTAFIFFFVSIFVMVMVKQEGKKSVTIFEKTNEVVSMLVNVMEAKNEFMRGHSAHVYNIICVFYSYLPRYAKQIINRTQLLDAALLHDIGKIGIDDAILNKNGPLTPDEWEVMRQYPAMGAEILRGTSYEGIGEIIRLHHERMDGLGYYGVAGANIPLESRMIMIADTFSALYSNRAYRGAQTFENAMRVIKESAGRQLDADLVEIFLTIPREALEAASFVVMGTDESQAYPESAY